MGNGFCTIEKFHDRANTPTMLGCRYLKVIESGMHYFYVVLDIINRYSCKSTSFSITIYCLNFSSTSLSKV